MMLLLILLSLLGLSSGQSRQYYIQDARSGRYWVSGGSYVVEFYVPWWITTWWESPLTIYDTIDTGAAQGREKYANNNAHIGGLSRDIGRGEQWIINPIGRLARYTIYNRERGSFLSVCDDYALCWKNRRQDANGWRKINVKTADVFENDVNSTNDIFLDSDADEIMYSMDEMNEFEEANKAQPSQFGDVCIGQETDRGFEFLSESSSLILERSLIQCREWEIRKEHGFNCGEFDCYSIKLLPDNLYLGKDIIDGVLSFNLGPSEIWTIGAAGSIVHDLLALKHYETNQFLCGRNDVGIDIEGQVFFRPNGDNSGCHWRFQ